MANSSHGWPSIVWSADRHRASVSRAVDRGTLLRLAPGLYTGEVDSDPADVVRRHLWEIIGTGPGAVISDRSARVAGPVGGSLFVVHPRTRPLVLPGVVVRPRSGPAALPGDTPLPFGLHLASATRTMLESLTRPGGNRLERIDVEHWLDHLAVPDAERRLNQIRDRAREVAPMLRASTAAAELERLIAAALSTGDLRVTTSPTRRPAAGSPIDHRLIVRLERLVADLADRAPSSLLDLPADAARRGCCRSTRPTSRTSSREPSSHSMKQRGSCSTERCQPLGLRTPTTSSALTRSSVMLSVVAAPPRTPTSSSGCFSNTTPRS